MEKLEFETLSDSEIRQKLIALGETKIGPVNFRTRKIYIKKLKSLIEQAQVPELIKSPDKYDPKYIFHKGEESGTCHSSILRSPLSPKIGRKSSVKRADSSTSFVNENDKSTPVKKRRTTANNKNSIEYESMDIEVAETSGSNKRRRTENSQELLTSSIIEPDENQDFGNMIAKKLRKYNTLTQNIIQNEIMSIFIKADSGYYDSN